MKVSVLFGGSEQASERAAAVGSVLAAAGHAAEVQRVPALRQLRRLAPSRPDVIHLCGAEGLRSARLAARLAGAALVVELPAGAEGAGRRWFPTAWIARGSLVLAADDESARRLRAGLGLAYLPPVVGGADAAGEADAVLRAVYDRLPSVAPGSIPAAEGIWSRLLAVPAKVASRRRTVLDLEAAGEPTRALEAASGGLHHREARRLSGLLRSFDPGWAPAPGSAAPAPAGDNGVLCLLESSLPQAPSGYAYRSRDLLTALGAAGAEPSVATRLGFPAGRGIPDWSPVEMVDGVIHHRFNLPGVRKYTAIPRDLQLEANAGCLLELVERTAPALVLAATPHLNGLLALAVRSGAGTPVVYDVRGFPEMTWATRPGGAESEIYSLRRAAESRCAREADAVITLSETMKEELVARGLRPDGVAVVPHVVDPELFAPRDPNPELRASYGLDARVVVGCVTTLRAYEGIDVLLRGLALARQQEPALAALIVGDGPERAPLESLSQELGLTGSVAFSGRVPRNRVPPLYDLVDVFALPRRDLEVCRKVTPLKPFEAMTMGVPILASDLPALAEPVTAAGGGRLVPPDSPEALAEALVELAGDEGARRSLGSRGRAHVLASHTPARAAEALRSSLSRLLG